MCRVRGVWCRCVMLCRRRWVAVVDVQTDFEELLALAQQHGVRVHEGMGPGAIVEELYGELVEAHTVEPTFYTDFPRRRVRLRRRIVVFRVWRSVGIW